MRQLKADGRVSRMKITINGRTACKGIGEGEALVCRTPFMFLSYVDKKSGIVYAEEHELAGKNVKDKVIVFPCGRGSTTEESSLFELKKSRSGPRCNHCWQCCLHTRCHRSDTCRHPNGIWI